MRCADELRDELVPLNRKYPIAELIAACRRYPGASNARRITFEYVMPKGVNDSQADARELVRLIAGIPAKVNLIPFNPWPGSAFETSSKSAIDRFAKIVMDAGIRLRRYGRRADAISSRRAGNCGQRTHATHPAEHCRSLAQSAQARPRCWRLTAWPAHRQTGRGRRMPWHPTRRKMIFQEVQLSRITAQTLQSTSRWNRSA